MMGKKRRDFSTINTPKALIPSAASIAPPPPPFLSPLVERRLRGAPSSSSPQNPPPPSSSGCAAALDSGGIQGEEGSPRVALSLSLSLSRGREMKYVLVTGGVVSGLGKGVTASSIGVVLKSCGLRITSIKIGTCPAGNPPPPPPEIRVILRGRGGGGLRGRSGRAGAEDLGFRAIRAGVRGVGGE